MRVKPITEKVWSCPWLCVLYFNFVNLLKHVCHPNTNNSFSLSLISYICFQIYLDIYGRWLFEMKPKQFDLMLGVFLTLSAAVLSSSLKRWWVSEWRQKQQPNVWDLLYYLPLLPPVLAIPCVGPPAGTSLWRHRVWKTSHAHGENNSRNHCPWLTLLSVLGTPPTHTFWHPKVMRAPRGNWNPVIQQVGRVATHKNSANRCGEVTQALLNSTFLWMPVQFPQKHKPIIILLNKLEVRVSLHSAATK